jgi:hypothetical protein
MSFLHPFNVVVPICCFLKFVLDVYAVPQDTGVFSIGSFDSLLAALAPGSALSISAKIALSSSRTVFNLSMSSCTDGSAIFILRHYCFLYCHFLFFFSFGLAAKTRMVCHAAALLEAIVPLRFWKASDKMLEPTHCLCVYVSNTEQYRNIPYSKYLNIPHLLFLFLINLCNIFSWDCTVHVLSYVYNAYVHVHCLTKHYYAHIWSCTCRCFHVHYISFLFLLKVTHISTFFNHVTL